MNKRAALIISEQGLQNLAVAGISTGWLKAWLIAAGARAVSVHLLKADVRDDTAADWVVFFGDQDELKNVAQQCGYTDLAGLTAFRLDNPVRSCWFVAGSQQQCVFLSLGDIAYQRHDWLSRLNGGTPLLPLYVRADDSLPLALEPGLSASRMPPDDGQVLNEQGLLIEEQVIAMLKQQKRSIRTVESCTAGGIAARLCRVPGASAVVDRAWVTYSNAAKQQEVGVVAELLAAHGAVSEAVVRAMAEGGADGSHVCLAVSGIAGPGGGTAEKPVGTVWIAFAMAGQEAHCQCLHLSGSRSEIQSRTVVGALNLLLQTVAYA